MLAGRQKVKGNRPEIRKSYRLAAMRLNRIQCILHLLPLVSHLWPASGCNEMLDSAGYAADTKDTDIAAVALLFS
jgi:hypothetical protein